MSKKSVNNTHKLPSTTLISVCLSLGLCAFLVWHVVAVPPVPRQKVQLPPEQTAPAKIQVPIHYQLPPPPQRTEVKASPPEAPQQEKAEPASSPSPPKEKKSAPKPPPLVQTLDQQQGRTLLRFLEHGKGPQIELAWPASPQERAALYQHLHQCFGMISAVLDTDGRLWRIQDPTHQDWSLNLDQYSGFLRQVSGRLSPTERDIFLQIKKRHAVAGQQVRLFPRAVDAALLGGISAALGSRYHQSQTIRARYHLYNNQVRIDSISADDHSYPQSFLLPTFKRC